MYIRVIILAIFSVLCFVDRACAQSQTTVTTPQKTVTDTIRLGPELLSYPELADRLSTPEQPIRCSRALRQRAALVYLKDRTRTQARDLLSKGLGIVFVSRNDPSGGKRTALTLEPDRKIERREARWRQIFGRNIFSLFQRRDQRRRAITQMPPADIKAQQDALDAELTKLDEANAPSSPHMLTLMDRRNEFYGVLPGEGNEDVPITRVGSLWYQHNAAWLSVGDAMEQGFQYRVAVADTLPGLEKTDVDKIARRAGGTGEHGYDTLFGGMVFRRGSDHVTIGVLTYLVSLRHSFTAPCDVPNMNLSMPHDLRPTLDSPSTQGNNPASLESRLTDDIFLGMTQLAQPFEGLGKDAVDWLNNERKDTSAVLAAEEERTKKEKDGVNNKKNTVPAPTLQPEIPVDTPSAMLWKWAAMNDREVIMELAPLAEADWRYRGDSLRAVFRPGSGWTLRDEAGVLIVTNQQAFLDHYRNVPTAALAALIRHMQERRKQKIAGNAPLTPTVDELLEYGRHATGTVAWGAEDIPFHFWGVSLPQLDACVPGVYLWDKMSTTEHLTLQKEGRFPLAQFKPSILQLLPAMFLSYPQMNGQWFHPDAVALLQQCYLTPDLRVVPSQPGIRLYGEETRAKP